MSSPRNCYGLEGPSNLSSPSTPPGSSHSGLLLLGTGSAQPCFKYPALAFLVFMNALPPWARSVSSYLLFGSTLKCYSLQRAFPITLSKTVSPPRLLDSALSFLTVLTTTQAYVVSLFPYLSSTRQKLWMVFIFTIIPGPRLCLLHNVWSTHICQRNDIKERMMDE